MLIGHSPSRLWLLRRLHRSVSTMLCLLSVITHNLNVLPLVACFKGVSVEHVHGCGCAWAGVLVYVHLELRGWIQPFFSPPTYFIISVFETGSLHWTWGSPFWPTYWAAEPWDWPVSTPKGRATDYAVFMWAGIWTHVPMLVQQALYSQSHHCLQILDSSFLNPGVLHLVTSASERWEAGGSRLQG